MKHYLGDRTIDGVKVTVDGVPCPRAPFLTESAAHYPDAGYRIQVMPATDVSRIVLVPAGSEPAYVLTEEFLSGTEITEWFGNTADTTAARRFDRRRRYEPACSGVVLYLVMIGHTVAAISLGVWGGIVVGWTDHMVRPFLISREAQIPFLLVMFGVLGGLAAFGLVGLFIGPVILAVLLAIWREWLHESGQPSEPAAPPAEPQAPRNMR